MRWTIVNIVFVLAVLAAVGASALAANEPIVSPEGYYEGTTDYSKDFANEQMSLSFTCKSAYWYTITRERDQAVVKGEGVANYDFKFAINWSIQKKVSFGLMKGIAVDLEPNVNLELDKGTARQKFYLSGSLAWPQDLEKVEVPLVLSWAPPGDSASKSPKLKFNVVATVGASMPAGTVESRNRVNRTTASASAGIGFTTNGSVLSSFEIDPTPPFGNVVVTTKLGKRSPFGPYASEGSKSQSEGKVSITVGWLDVQKIDFNVMRRLAEMERRERGSRP